MVRTGTFLEKLIHLQETNFLKKEVGAEELKRMAAYCSLIGRFWLSDYWVSQQDGPVEQMMEHYLSLLAAVFLPYVTPRGDRDLASYLNRK